MIKALNRYIPEIWQRKRFFNDMIAFSNRF
jgi:hypothetical protein